MVVESGQYDKALPVQRHIDGKEETGDGAAENQAHRTGGRKAKRNRVEGRSNHTGQQAKGESRKNCRFGWEEIGSFTTKYPTNGCRSTAINTKAPEMMAPRITGGNVSMNGQTCAP